MASLPLEHRQTHVAKIPALAAVTIVIVAAVVVVGCSPPDSGAAPGGDPRGSAERWAIRGVDVVPMDRSVVLPDRTVVVLDGIIARLGPAVEVEVPSGIEVVDGAGLWLMPGLVDTHVHVDDPDDLLLYLVNGVTTVVNLRGSARHLEWREELGRSERLGPRMLTCGPFLHGPRLEVDEIDERVREIAADGYDCVKIYDDWELDAYRQVAVSTRETGILFLGHAPREIGLDPVLADGRQRIVHLEELVYATPALDKWVEAFEEEPWPEETDPQAALSEEVERVARQLARAGIRVAATEVVLDTYLERSTPEGMSRLAARPYTRYLDPFRQRRWAVSDEEDHGRFVHQVALQHLLLRALRDQGVSMALGTDASTDSNLLVMPGWSAHEELELLVEAGGFTPYEALRQATVDAFGYLSRPGAGVVAEGAPADLLVLRENPLLDVAHAGAIETVIVAGDRHPIADLHSQLEERRARWAPLEQALDEVETTREQEGVAAAALAYLRIADEHPAYGGEVEGLVNALGYELLSDGRTGEAIEVFRANAEAFADSANTWDSLAEAHLETGNRKEAVRLYRRALSVDPGFSNARRMLRDLGADPEQE